MNKLDKLKEYLQLMSDSLTREEFTAAFKLLMDFVVKLEKNLTTKIDSKTDGAKEELEDIKKLYKEAVGKLEKDNASTLSNLKRWALERVGELFIRSKIKERIIEVDNKLAELNAYEPPTTEVIAAEASKLASEGLLPLIPTIPNIKEEISKSGDIIATTLENLNDDEKLKIEAIKDLQKTLDELKKQSVRVGGGGFSYIAMDQHIVDFEIPIDSGDHLTFTINHTPSPTTSFHLFRSRTEQIPTTDYALTGVNLVLTVAFDSSSESLYCHYRI